MRVTCWSCGTEVTPKSAEPVAYHCAHCDVLYRPSVWMNDIFTDPEAMRRKGYIDHGAVHMPSPA